MVEGLAQHLRAELVPVRTRVPHVQMPRHVHVDGRRAHVPLCHAEKDELAVLVDHAQGIVVRPFLLVRKPLGERFIRTGFVEDETLQLRP